MPRCAAPTPPRFEHRTDAGPVLGMGTGTPRLSWTVPTAAPRWRQSAYEVEVVRGGTASTWVAFGADQVLVPWPDLPLRSRERAAVRVRVAQDDDWSEWSAPAVVEAGLLHAEDWTGRFVSPIGIGGIGTAAPILGGTLELAGDVRSARLYATAHGIYSARINGRRVDDTVLAPGWTSYEHRLRYHVHDVTELLRSGTNRLEVVLGNGWHRGRLAWAGQRALYGDRLALLAQLQVTTTDGREHLLATDETWTAWNSVVLADDLYDGQRTDLRRRAEETTVHPVEIVEGDVNRLVAPDGPPMRPTGVLSAQRVWSSPSGRTLVDFGQNAVGWVRLRVRGLAEGAEVVLRHAEVLEDEELGTRPLRSAQATDSYVIAGPDDEVLEPSMTLHGFRYAEVTGVPELRADDLELVVVGTDLRRTGWFESSNEPLDRLHENVVWSMRGNFVDIPSDCPQRDERLGWTGDLQLFAPAATYLFDTGGFLRSWLADLAAEQQPDGAVPQIVPDVIRSSISKAPAAAWGDAATFVPWTVYLRTGDRGLLARQLPSMRAWVDRVTELAGPERLWAGGFQYGDWLDPAAPPEDPFRSKADPDVVATAHFARSAQTVADAARVLGRDDEAQKYAVLASQVREAFARAFVTPAGRVLSDSQTVYALALEWDLLPDEAQRREAARRLADLVRAGGFRIGTGFVGTPLVCDALANAGHVDVAYRLLLQTECPSWLYPVTMGATTVWERWDSMRPDGSINPGEMTSFNHYALGAVVDWLHRSVAGLAPAEPGYRRITVRPQLTDRLTHAATRHLTPYGEAGVAWNRTDGRLHLHVVLPVGTSANVHIPGADAPVTVGHGEHRWDVADPERDRNSGTGDRAAATVRELLDDEHAWAAIVTAAVDAGLAPLGEADAARRLAPYLDAPATALPQALAPEDRFPDAHAARRLLVSLVSPADAGSGVVLAAAGPSSHALTQQHEEEHR